MITAQQMLDVVSNNLANASTNGYKEDGMTFANAMEQQLTSQGAPIGSIGTGATMVNTFTNFSPGSIASTGNPLDIAIGSPVGAFAVQTGPASIGYTRDGSFALNTSRELVTKDGYQVLGTNGSPIQVQQGDLQIGEDGTVTAGGQVAGKIAVFDGQFQKIGGNLWEPTDSSTVTPISAPLEQGSIESSNVNPVQAMIQMITLNRAFELAQNTVTQNDTLTQRLVSSLQQ